MTNEELQRENEDLKELLKIYANMAKKLMERVDELTLKILD